MDFPSRRRSSRPSRGDSPFRDPRELETVEPEPEPEPAAEPPRSERPRSPRSETLARIAWTVPWIAFTIAIVVVGGIAFAVAMIALASIALVELFRMTARARPFQAVGFAAAAGLILAAYLGDSFQIVLVGVAFFPVMFGFAAARDNRRHVTYSMAVTVLAVVWIGLPFAHAVLLREIEPHGAGLLVDVLVATFLADTSAYFGGRLFGRTQLAPGISPGKTLEGLGAGFLGGTLGFWFAGLYQDWMPGTDALLIGAAIAAIAPLGDLFESMVKRDLDVKDTSGVFGPHGGILDRIDAALFTVVAGYYLVLAFGF